MAVNARGLLIATGDEAPLADRSHGQYRRLGRSGGQGGRVTGAFFHVIARL
ncbi:MAG: hypothetical protein WA636_05525 [Methylovirgula sp.]